LRSVATHHQVAKYNPLVSGAAGRGNHVGSSDEDEDGDQPPADRNRLDAVMGDTLPQSEGRKASKAEASSMKRISRKVDDEDAGETEAASASRIANSFQSWLYYLFYGCCHPGVR
jgi:hypothetical protein